jgi:predicted RNA-binding Zn-ribbon protein involved in translation (DUF1610 family)
MRAHVANGPAARTATRSGHGFLDKIRDFFSPTLTCEACGTDIKRYRCERTGEVHTVPEDQPMSRWTTIEIEYRCPECGDSIWYVDTSSQYPYPMF